jgi:hypothetical protein
MKVFFSWSGVTSRAVAEALADWTPKVIQGIDPFVSAKDIDKGANWTVELARELEDAEFGIICLAPDNLLSPWLNYETGAITKSVNSRVCPVLFAVEKTDVKPPMAQLQLTSLDQMDVLLLMTSMNKAAGEPIGLPALREAVEVWWPLLEGKIKAIPVPEKADQFALALEPTKPQVDPSEMIEEVLHRIRDLDNRMRFSESREQERQSLTRNRPSEAVTKLSSAVAGAGYGRRKIVEIESSITVHIPGELPDVLPAELHEAGWKVSRSSGKRVQFIGLNRTATFEKDGQSDEMPF